MSGERRRGNERERAQLLPRVTAGCARRSRHSNLGLFHLSNGYLMHGVFLKNGENGERLLRRVNMRRSNTPNVTFSLVDSSLKFYKTTLIAMIRRTYIRYPANEGDGTDKLITSRCDPNTWRTCGCRSFRKNQDGCPLRMELESRNKELENINDFSNTNNKCDICTSRHCGTSHMATTKGRPLKSYEGLHPNGTSAPHPYPNIVSFSSPL